MMWEENETAESINEWAKEAFGPIPEECQGRAVERALEELVEAYETTEGFYDQMGGEEMLSALEDELADTAIVLLRLCGHFGKEPGMNLPPGLQLRIDEKMQKNRMRRWKPDGTGHGYHIKEDDGA